MTSTEPVTLPTPPGPPPDDDTTHVVCMCQRGRDRELTFCGHDATTDPEGASTSLCVVCMDLLKRPCQHCGTTW